MASPRDKYRTLVELAPDAIFLIDASGTIVEANERATDLVEYERGDLEGSKVTTIHPDEKADQYSTLLERTIEEAEIRTESLPNGDQIYLVTQSGANVPVELHARTLQVDGERWVYTIVRNITERHEREQELERHRKQLEQFASVVSHDLRNPLNVAQLRLDLAREECDSEHLNDLETALDRMETLIENTLSLAEQGQTITEREQIVLADLLADCWEMVETDAATLEYESLGERTVYGDPERLRQVFENLFRNAVEHGLDEQETEDSLTIRITAGESTLHIDDDGPGLSPDDRESVFEPGETTSEDGTGFGLAIVDRICEAHGWEISVTNGELGGACFEISGIEFD
jgi:PAS domain S-box-containing protein